MGMTTTVLYLTAPGVEVPTGAADLERVASGLSVERVGSVADVRDRIPGADCVVYADSTAIDRRAARNVAAVCARTPLIYYALNGNADPATVRAIDGIDAYVRRAGEASAVHLADEIEWLCERAPRPPNGVGETAGADVTAGDDRSNLSRFHEMATRIAACRDEDRLFELAIETADAVLEFDSCVVMIAEGERFLPAAHSSMPDAYDRSQPLECDVADETLRTGETHRIDDSRERPLGGKTAARYRSIVSVPIGEYGVFQAVSERPAAFDEADEELGELLVSHVAEAVARVRAERELVTERDRLAALFENVPDPAVRYEFRGDAAIVRDVNPAFEERFGYDRATVVGENVDDYVVPPDLEDEARRLNETLMAGESLRTVSRRRTADGLRDVLINVVPLEMGERSGEGFSIYTDITDQKRRERELTAQNERLDEFASIVSHDLRNPLNVARGYLERAIETGDEAHFAEVEAAHERMALLIETLLTLSRQGEVIAETEPVSVHDAAERAWALVDTESVALELGADGVLEADEERLLELLENLLRNAVEHGSMSPSSNARKDAVEHGSTTEGSAGRDETPSASDEEGDEKSGEGDDEMSGEETEGERDDPPLTVRVGATANGFFVADDGPGIPTADREVVFESGHTTSGDGTGYGLAIVEQIADAHGWTVRVADSADGGARFEIEKSTIESERRGESDAREPEFGS